MELTAPQVRIRISHSRTQRDGWQYESTVELVDVPDMTAVSSLLEQFLHHPRRHHADRDVSLSHADLPTAGRCADRTERDWRLGRLPGVRARDPGQ